MNVTREMVNGVGVWCMGKQQQSKKPRGGIWHNPKVRTPMPLSGTEIKEPTQRAAGPLPLRNEILDKPRPQRPSPKGTGIQPRDIRSPMGAFQETDPNLPQRRVPGSAGSNER